MKFQLSPSLISLIVGTFVTTSSQGAAGHNSNSTYTNPILPGWHSDPSCTFVKEWDNTAFCVSSSFLAFPGLPIYASKDLLNWKQISNTFERPTQIPDLGSIVPQQHGLWAATIRYHDNLFYVIVTLRSASGATGLIFTSTNPYDGTAWSIPTNFTMYGYDPDIFWDDDGKVYVCSNLYGTSIGQVVVDPLTGSQGTLSSIWSGTGGSAPEGPHIYKKDGYYYLMVAEGGTQLGHKETIARSTNITGPYEAYENNPILTNTNTTEYFQTVAHADLFQDSSDNWWGVALATRSGPEYKSYPMGRETVLYPVTWNKGDWPILQPVRGKMSGWPLPPTDRKIPGAGPFVDDPDNYDFAPGSTLPLHFMSWRYLPNDALTISPLHNPFTLQINPSRGNLTGSSNSTDAISFVGRRQTHTLFNYSVGVSFNPNEAEEEAGVTVFLTQYQHIDLGIVLLPSSSGAFSPFFRFRITSVGNDILPSVTETPIPSRWIGRKLRLEIQALNLTHYTFGAALAGHKTKVTLGEAPVTVVSGGTGLYTGAILGTYATRNGGTGTAAAYISRWRYKGVAQYIGNGEYVY
ncbi:xylosidase : arabinofuranosidase [Bisporella sp. PMI_857]|nr:xylosidase : arabinofuranosidase [Bisporella sp. PMI_857]